MLEKERSIELEEMKMKMSSIKVEAAEKRANTIEGMSEKMRELSERCHELETMLKTKKEECELWQRKAAAATKSGRHCQRRPRDASARRASRRDARRAKNGHARNGGSYCAKRACERETWTGIAQNEHASAKLAAALCS